MDRWRIALGVMIVALIAVVGAPIVFAAEINLGKHSKDEIKNACNAAGGDLLGVSDSGSYGCEVGSKGTMILCNKDGNCTGYTPARTKADGQRILNSLNLKGKVTVKSSTEAPK
jgi:hypothetical protein